MADRHVKAAETRAARMQEQIIRASKPLFDAQSPHDLTYRAIAKAARSTPETVRRYFPSLSTLAIEVYADQISEFRERLQKRDAQKTNPLVALTFELMTLFVRHPSLAAAFLDEAEKDADDRHPTYRATVIRLEARISAYRSGGVPKTASHEVGTNYLQMIIRRAHENFRRDEEPNPKKIMPLVISLTTPPRQ